MLSQKIRMDAVQHLGRNSSCEYLRTFLGLSLLGHMHYYKYSLDATMDNNYSGEELR